MLIWTFKFKTSCQILQNKLKPLMSYRHARDCRGILFIGAPCRCEENFTGSTTNTDANFLVNKPLYTHHCVHETFYTTVCRVVYLFIPVERLWSGLETVVKVVLWSRGAHLTKPGWSKPHTQWLKSWAPAREGAGWASAHSGKNHGGHGPPWKF